MPTERILGSYERFSLARSLAGVAPVVAVTALLPADRLDPTQFATAIDSLLAEYPLLSCIVAAVTTTEPRFEPAPVTASNVLVDLADPPAEPPQALLAALEAVKDNGVEHAPLWRVWLSATDAHGWRRVTLAVHHVLSDGSSTRNIFAELLSRARTPRAAEPLEPMPVLPPTLEDSVDVRPGLLALLKALFDLNVLDHIPSFLRFWQAYPTFPSPPLVPPYQQGTSLKHLSLPSSSLARLNAAAKAHGVATLHPVLYVAFLAALSTVAPRRTTLIGQSPMSLRNADRASHPPISGNYVCSLETSHGEPAPLTPFWDACAAYGARIVDPAERARAKGEMGFLGLLPNEPHVGADEAAPQRTTFDTWMEDVLQSEEPWKATFEVSNLGVLPATGWEGDGGLDEVLWAQAGMALGPAFAVNAIAVRGGSLAMSMTWRLGTVDEATVAAIWEAYERALRRLADEEVAQDVTFEGVAL
ncbi:hypothetical protein JCM9279_007038 [Rhodotorula babjevae]